MSRLLLLDEQPLLVMPKLATEIGLNEAIVLQQIHYWLNNPKAGVTIDGEKWVYNSVPQWAEQFPFWSEATIKRTLQSLRNQGYLIAESLSKDKRNKTLYYRIYHSKLGDPCIRSNCTDGSGQNDQMIIYTENTTETTTKETAAAPIPVKRIHDLYNEVCKDLPTSRGMTPKREEQIRARWSESKERQSIEWWKGLFEYANSLDFLVNGSGSWKGANLEWITNPNNLVKIIEGQYENE